MVKGALTAAEIGLEVYDNLMGGQFNMADDYTHRPDDSTGGAYPVIYGTNTNTNTNNTNNTNQSFSPAFVIVIIIMIIILMAVMM